MNRLRRRTSNDNDHPPDLQIRGYGCKLYRDDRWRQFSSGQHLIPWMADPNIMIDRYDARGYLNDLSQLDGGGGDHHHDSRQPDEIILNQERFRDLYDKTDESDTDHRNDSGRQYSRVGYTYNQPTKKDSGTCDDDNANNEDTGESHDFEPPPGLNLPLNICPPKSRKLHQIIEKTAAFVANQGLQMEILLKTKQAGNSNFEFLSFESKLNPYYKYLLEEIKSGRYVARDKSPPPDNENDSESDEDENYLHPSLLSAAATTSRRDNHLIPMPAINATDSNSSYSQLVKQFQDKFSEDISTPEPVINQQQKAEEKDADLRSGVSPLIPKPPGDIELIITKLAEHVAKIGESFENTIKALDDRKFDFLNNGHIYHAYYVKQKIHFVNQHKTERKSTKETTKARSGHNAIAFSLNVPTNNKTSAKLVDNESVQKHLAETAAGANTPKPDDEKESKEKRLQEERKRKVYKFLQALRKQEKNGTNSPAPTYGPNLPRPPVELSPTIEQVTSPTRNSPPATPVNQNSQNEPDQSDPSWTGRNNGTTRNSESPMIHREPTPITYSEPKRYRRHHDRYDESPERSSSSSGHRRSRKHKKRKSRSRSKERHHQHHRRRHRHHRRSRSRSSSRSRSRSRHRS